MILVNYRYIDGCAYLVMRRPALIKRQTHEMASHGVFSYQFGRSCMSYEALGWLNKDAVVHSSVAHDPLYIVFSKTAFSC